MTAYPQARVVTLRATGTTLVRAGSVEAYRHGEFEMAVWLAPATGHGDVVDLRSDLPSVHLWQAYREQRPHLVMRGKNYVARETGEPLPGGTCLVPRWRGGRCHRELETRSVTTRLIEYRADVGETIRLLT